MRAKGAELTNAVAALVVPDAAVLPVHGEAPAVDHLAGIIITVGGKAQHFTDFCNGNTPQAASAVAAKLIYGLNVHVVCS